MQAIHTHIIAPTDFHGPRISAKAEAGKIIIDFPQESKEPFRYAAEALCKKLGWPANMAEGVLPSGNHVFVML